MPKVCTLCKKEKTPDDFYNHENGRLGKFSRCKQCLDEYHRQWTDKTFTKLCPSCNNVLPRHAFVQARSRPSGLASHCKECRKSRYPHNPTQHRLTHLRHRYGLEWEELITLFERQNKQCGICKKELKLDHKNTHVDHCHHTKKVRGVLCSDCNKGLGLFHDNCETMQGAIMYLKRDSNGN